MSISQAVQEIPPSVPTARTVLGKPAAVMSDFLKRSWATVDLDCIGHNIEKVKELVSPGCKVLGVVKADAYGHGAKFVARELNRHGVDWFGVSNVEEAVSLRRDGIFKPILIFGTTPAQYAGTLCEYSITQAVFSTQYARQLSQAAQELGVTVDAHVKVDTGMGRLGFLTDEGNLLDSAQKIQDICGLPGLKFTGIFTHFSCADETNADAVAYTKGQFSRFMEILKLLEKKGIIFPIRHCCNSAATLLYPQMHLDMVRPGIVLYGLSPSGDCGGILDLHPALSLTCCISQVKTVEPGTYISYGRTWCAKEPRVIASVTIGYADGYHRILSNRARMLVRGRLAPVVGRVCMDQLMLDVTGIDGVCPGDTAVMIGTDGENTLTADEMATLTDSINYEVVCLVGKRVPRIYMQNGRQVGVTNYVGQTIEE